MSEIKVTSLHTYPIKSCAAIDLDQSLMTATGLEYDRNFMVTDAEGNLISQRQIPEMALIIPKIVDDELIVSAPGMTELVVPLNDERKNGATMKGIVHGKDAWGQLVSSEADDWFSEYLPAYRDIEKYKLLRVAAHLPRLIKQKYRDIAASNRVGFADGYPIHLTSTVSLEELNGRLDEPAPMDRFRPNIVVTSKELEPYDEDKWRKIRIGNITAFVVKACDRCVIPDLNQLTAEKGKEVRRALAFTRRGVNRYNEEDTGVFFGQNLNHVFEEGAVISVGDVVVVEESDAEPNVLITPKIAKSS